RNMASNLLRKRKPSGESTGRGRAPASFQETFLRVPICTRQHGSTFHRNLGRYPHGLAERPPRRSVPNNRSIRLLGKVPAPLSFERSMVILPTSLPTVSAPERWSGESLAGVNILREISVGENFA